MSACTIVLCGIEWLAWHVSIPGLTGPLSAVPRIQPATAILLVGDAVALALTVRRTRGTGILLAGLIALANALEGAADVLHPGSGTRFVREHIIETGVPSPDTAFVACVGAIATALVSMRRRSWVRAGHALAVVAIAMGLFVVVAHLFGARALYSVSKELGMSPVAAAAVVLLGFGALSVAPRFTQMWIFYAPGEGGRLARRFLPFVFGLPLFLAAIVAYGLRHGICSAQAGIALLMVCVVAALGIVTWRYALNVNAAERRLEQLVARRTRSLTETIADTEEFSNALAHDVRGPLINLRKFLDLVIEDHGGELSREAREYIERSIKAGRRIDRLTTALLRYGELSRRIMRPGPVKVDEIVNRLRDELSSGRGTASVFSVPGPLPVIWADEPIVTEVLRELVENARQFARPGQPPRITVTGIVQPLAARILVHDEGVGVKPEYQDRIFRPFEQLARNERVGIGLALVRRAVSKMNGRVGVISDGVNGSTFWIELPRPLPE